MSLFMRHDPAGPSGQKSSRANELAPSAADWKNVALTAEELAVQLMDLAAGGGPINATAKAGAGAAAHTHAVTIVCA